MNERNLCQAYYLGLVEYGRALQLQQALVKKRKKQTVGDLILLLQHYPVITIGHRGNEKNIIVSKEVLKKKSISVFHTDRGGDVTLHCPGQLVAYPIFDLSGNGRDIHKYLHDIEEVVILTVKHFFISAGRIAGYPGVWAGDKKVAAIGIKISRRITMHGFALNIYNDLKQFDYIHPCGINTKGITSMSRLLGYRPDIMDVKTAAVRAFSEVFNVVVEEKTEEDLKKSL